MSDRGYQPDPRIKRLAREFEYKDYDVEIDDNGNMKALDYTKISKLAKEFEDKYEPPNKISMKEMLFDVFDSTTKNKK